MDNKFSMYVLSNGSSEYFPDNTLSKFSVKIPFSLDLPISFNEKWGIAIKGIGLSSKFISDYSEKNQMPLIIELMNLVDHEHCNNFYDEEGRKSCDFDIYSENKKLRSSTGKCFDDELEIEHCTNINFITEQIDKWAEGHLKTESFLRIVGELKYENSLIYNIFFNTLKNRRSLEILLDRLAKNLLVVKEITDTKFSVSNHPDRQYERIFFLRGDFCEKSEITQDTFLTPETNEIITTTNFHLTRTSNHAQFLNNSDIILSNTPYKIFILNHEFVNLNIDFKKFEENFLSIPNLIKIKCDNIRAQIFNDHHSKDIEVIKPRFHDKLSHYFHEFEDPIFLPLLNTRLRDLTFELTDEYNNRLMLDEGIPTLLQLSFKKMSNSNRSFSVRLTPTIQNSENSVNKFTNILPATLNFNENWRVGLKEITFPSIMKSLPNDNNQIIVSILDESLNKTPHPDNIFTIVNQVFDKTTLVKKLNDRMAVLNILKFSIVENCLHVISKENCEIGVSYNLAKFFNMKIYEDPNEKKPEKIKIEVKKKMDTKIGNDINWYLFRPAFLMIYTDFVKPTLISSEYTNILRIVPVRREEKNVEYQSIEFKNVEFREIATNFVNIINIEIRSHSGELVQFSNNFLSIHLYFTNENHNNI